ncbi:MAG: transglutaminase family protein [Azoarcus sp.]|nr:transglutaminase family protein [Azoarcus sp.]
MSLHVALSHITSYRYARPVALGPQIVRLRPAPHSRTRILSYSLRVSPEKHFINWQQDPQSNYLARLVFPEETDSFRVEVDLVAEMAVHNPFDFFLEPYAEYVPFRYESWQAHELAPYLLKLPAKPEFTEYLARIDRGRLRTVDFLVRLNCGLCGHIKYLTRLEPGVQTPGETLTRQSGSCRDSAWLLVQLLRHLGLAARFVSGYLIQLAPDVKPLDGPSGPEADFTDLHAWCEVYLPGAGWIGLDPTSGLLAGEGHIPLACSPDPVSAAPITGAIGKCEATFEHRMKVARIRETPRATKPYSEEQWAAIERLGYAVDAGLASGDVRLTQGGEPTFVPVDNPDGVEWNTAAMGPDKKRLAADLYHRLRDKYGAGGLVHFGQGKWYPGEPLPRWSLNCFWRRDGEPVWRRADLVADEARPAGADEAVAGRFLRAVAEELGLEPQFVFPGYEDAYYYLWREQRLPANVDPFDARLDDPLERERLMRVFTQGLANATGYALPIMRDHGRDIWRTGPWFLRAGRCYLVPGDSPMGYRLPLDSQPWTSATGQPDPFAPLHPLPAATKIRRQFEVPAAVAETDSDDPARTPRPFEPASWVVRTAMCAEARNGTLYVFMPPSSALEDYLEIVAAVEAVADRLAQPVLLEGYEPPRDARLQHFRITPDTGVIEINIHPASDWSELVEQTAHLYDAAHLSRLSSEKFMIDGRHTGTGGGNHFVLGGATPADSPFLRRPDLLTSLVGYWHNHPGLSYLFSGLFIGPASQAPRIDEARNDPVAEIELAFRELNRQCGRGSACSPWLVDRLLRNLLIDVGGNTHRTEFCIDKLYSTDSPAGRLGLLEMRAFEMPPHARMSLTQQLLLRALVARFWEEPYVPARLVRWDTELHDRFMLPHFVWQDFHDVVDELRACGYPFELEWFAPHLEFRFPVLGDYAVQGMRLELRAALDPWRVMGEEGADSGAARYVDSSLERIQVKFDGVTPDRYAVTCNGVTVPLRPTGVAGEFVAGVRYRAWQPASALHPVIGVDSPLTFDIVDTWNQKSLGGCQYHVSHPGGRNFETFPVNAFEAESRRIARFFRFGHTPGKIFPREVRSQPEFPFTLDLRHC